MEIPIEPDIHKYPLIGGTLLYLRDRKQWCEKMIECLEDEINEITEILEKP